MNSLSSQRTYNAPFYRWWNRQQTAVTGQGHGQDGTHASGARLPHLDTTLLLDPATECGLQRLGLSDELEDHRMSENVEQFLIQTSAEAGR